VIDLESHFAFGENWASYAKRVDKPQIDEAIAGLRRLLGDYDLAGKRFLDIGCGSGIHSVAASCLGASEILAVDLDPDCIATTKALLARFAPDSRWRVEQTSVFDLAPEALGTFSVVYSWGVLHHTGNMGLAMRKATAMVADGGRFVFALYYRTWMCPFWTMEKRWYARASRTAQSLARGLYVALFGLRLWASGRSLRKHVADYPGSHRGMDFHHDVHDWLGGYPYESISSDEVDTLMRQAGMARAGSFVQHRPSVGLFGSGCNEYAYARLERDEDLLRRPR
jgi:2-polyprenyl-6-hydroxyphenyl methylase/3-demethylubiquinone-9 3-methyltransferase